MEKKIYCTPKTEVLELELESQMLTGSLGGGIEDGAEVGGEILPGEDFDAKERSGLFFYEW